MTMRMLVVDDAATIDRAGAQLVAAWLDGIAAPVVVPALGRSALGIYAELGRRRLAGTLDASRMTLVQLDSYTGIAPEDPRSLYGWLLRDVAAPLGVSHAQVIRLPGDTGDPDAAAVAHAATIERLGGIDLAILGLGPNGHLGFNEPPSAADAPTRAVDLTPASLASCATYWGPSLPVPRRALTIGMRELLAARRILLVVQGPAKRSILTRLLTHSPSPDLPGSFLRDLDQAVLLADSRAWPATVPEPRTTLDELLGGAPTPEAGRVLVADRD
jgi:glucosamine-6-phosphate deaminase